jgi:BirA family biotin operon repressor/biotin-[acetyl-CoA-carboxylase] ligase
MQNLASFPDRQIIASEIQTRGQGRMNRNWVSDIPGNIYITIILKPDCPSVSEGPLVNISQYMSVCICELIESLGIKPSLKWPNDILVEGKKIGGILCQTSILGKRLAGFALGTGINLNMRRKDLLRIDQPAISLNLLTGSPVDRDRFLENLAEIFFTGYDQFMELGFPSIIEPYQKRSPYLGSRIRARLPGGDVSGIALRITENGCLLIETSEGKESILNAGDIMLSNSAGSRVVF